MRQIRQSRRQHPRPPAAPPERPSHGVVGVIRHPTTGHYQVWVHGNGQTVMLLAYRWPDKAQRGAAALRAALARGEGASVELWCAAVRRVGAHADGQLEPVPQAVFAAIAALLHPGAPGSERMALRDEDDVAHGVDWE